MQKCSQREASLNVEISQTKFKQHIGQVKGHSEITKNGKLFSKWKRFEKADDIKAALINTLENARIKTKNPISRPILCEKVQ